MSPWVATTRPSFTPTMTPQPVPQKRQGALSHFSRSSSPSGMFCACAGRVTLAATAAAAAAWAFIMSRRESSMAAAPGAGFAGMGLLELVEDEGGGEHAAEELDLVQAFDDLALGPRLKRDDEFPLRHTTMDLHAVHGAKSGRDVGGVLPAAVNDEAGDVEFARHRANS